MGGEITYLLPNFNGAKISNFTPHFTGMWLLIHAGVKANPCARGPVYVYLVQGALVIPKSSGWFQDVCYTAVFHMGEAMYISLIGFQWTSTAIKSFQWFYNSPLYYYHLHQLWKFCDVHSLFTITYMPFPGEILLKEAMSAGGPELDKFLFS